MVKNKGLRFLLTAVITVVAILIANFIDLAFSTNGRLILTGIYTLFIWLLYLLHADLLNDPFAIITRFLKNATLVLLIAFYVITLILGGGATFSSTDNPEVMISATLIAPSLAFPLALYAAKKKGLLLEWSPLVPSAIIVISAIVSLVFSILGSLSWIVGLVALVASVIAGIIFFKNRYVCFISLKPPKFVSTAGLSGKDDDDDKKKGEDSPIKNALLAIRSVGGVGTRLTWDGTTFTAKITTKLTGNGTLEVSIGGDVHIAENERGDVQRSLDEEISKTAQKVVDKYHYEAERLHKLGVDVSCMSSLKVSGGPIYTR